MNKELRDKAWKALPKEFQEEVKKSYQILCEQYKEYDELHFENAKAQVLCRKLTLEHFFGYYNIISNIEEKDFYIVEKVKF